MYILIHWLKYSALGFIPVKVKFVYNPFVEILAMYKNRFEKWTKALVVVRFGLCQMNHSYNPCKDLDTQIFSTKKQSF